MGPVGPQTHPVIISRIPECIIGIYIVSSWWTPNLSLVEYYGGRGQVETTRVTSIKETSKPEAAPYSWRDYRDECHHQGPERCKGSNSYHIPIHLTSLPVQETDGSWWMAVDYCRPNQVVSPAAAVPDVVALLEQINTCPGTWNTIIDLESAFPSTLVNKHLRSSLLSSGKASNTPSLFYLRGISAPQPSVII